MTRTANPHSDHAARATTDIDNRSAYNDAVKGRIMASATNKKRAAWLAAVEGREALMEVVQQRAFDKGGFWASIAEAYEQWGSLTAGQEAAVARILAQDASRKAERLAADSGSTHVGTVGVRQDWTLTLQGRFEYDTDFGTTYGHVFKDADGNVVIYKGSTRLPGERGDTLALKATVKAHDARDGIAQTLISRPKMGG